MAKNRVLIPIDRSPFSMSIVPYVEQFLEPAKNELVLLHIAEEPTPAELHRSSVIAYTAQLNHLRTSLQTQVTEELQPVTDKLQACGFQVTVAVDFGEPITQIEHFIGAHDIDLIAMSTHGRSGLGRVLFGSVAQELLQQLSLPILLFHPRVDNGE